MKLSVKKYVKQIVILALGLLVSSKLVAGVPLNNIEGVGGVAFNPLAYPSGQNKDTTGSTDPLALENIFSKPQIGGWYVNLGDVGVDWTSISISETLFDRLELSYAHEVAAVSGGPNIGKDNFGAKVLIIKENQFDTQWVPAVSVGGIVKKTNHVAAGTDDTGVDAYIVATKLITQLPKPVLVSAGVLSSSGKVTGVFGYDHQRAETFFGNIDIIPIDKVAVGFEYKQGARFSDFKNADYYDAHVAWFANKNLTLVGAYVNAGNEKSTSSVGLGQGVVVSAQYAF